MAFIDIEMNARYYTSLEAEVYSSERFVSLEENNFGTFSLHYTMLLQAAASECDVVAKIIWAKFKECLGEPVDPDLNLTITNYRLATMFLFPKIHTQAVNFPGHHTMTPRLRLKPFCEWVFQDMPTWWIATTT